MLPSCNRFLFSFLFLLCSCCVSMPKEEQTENLLPSPSLDVSVNTSIDTPFFAIGDWPQENWWEVFQSDELNALVEMALCQNPTIYAAIARFEMARQESVIARAELFPWASFVTTDNKEYLSRNGLYRALNPTIPLNANLIDIFFSVEYEFDFWCQYRNLYLAAIGEQRAQQIEVAQVRLVIAALVVEAYVALKVDLLRQQLYEQLVEVYARLLQLQTRLKTSALSSQLPVLSMEEDLLEAKKNLAKIEESIAIDKHLLNVLLGRGPDACLEIDTCLPYLPERMVIPCDLSVDLLARRPDLMAQIWRVEALGHRVGAAIADFYPNINFSLLLGFESTKFYNLLQSHSKTMTFAPALHLPIFTAGAIQANVDAHRAEFNEAVFMYDDLILGSAQEVADLLAVGKSVFIRQQEQQAIVESAQQRYQLRELRKKSGLDSSFNTYEIQLEVIQDQLRNVDLIYEKYAVEVRLMKALGGGYRSPCGVPLQACESW